MTPRRQRVLGKSARVAKSRLANEARANPRLSKDWIILPPSTADEMFEEMRTALHDTMGYVQALLLIGHGLEQIGREEGDAVVSVASAAQERLRIIEDAWLDYVQALRR